MPKINEKVHLNCDRDISLLVWLWRFKVGTTAALSQKFFAQAAPATAYRRLWRLEKGGFIESRTDRSGRKSVWLLAKRGYQVVRCYLPYELKEEGYKSEHVGHDLVATAFHLGDWMVDIPRGVKLFTEQQFRRYHHEDHPDWIKNTHGHIPDGLTCVDSGTAHYCVAFEAELHVKTKSSYRYIYYDYGDGGPDFVFWLAPTLTAAERIMAYLSSGETTDKGPRHNFITLRDFYSRGWSSKIVCGPNFGSSITEIMGKLTQNQLKTESNRVVSQCLLNLSKTPFKSKTCKYYELGDFSN